jgi:uncharacterized protein
MREDAPFDTQPPDAPLAAPGEPEPSGGEGPPPDGRHSPLARYGSWPWVLGVVIALVAITAVVFIPLTSVLLLLDPGLSEDEFAGLPLVLFLGILTQGVAGVLVVYLLLVRRGVLTWKKMGLTGPRAPNFVLRGVGWGLLFLLVAAVIEALQRQAGVEISQPEFEAIRDATPLGKLGIWIAGVVVAPLSEEIVFRGYIFRAISARKGLIRGMLYSSALFAFLHIDPTQGLENAGAFLPILAGAAIIALAYHRSGDLWVPITAHLVNNALAFTALLLS